MYSKDDSSVRTRGRCNISRSFAKMTSQPLNWSNSQLTCLEHRKINVSQHFFVRKKTNKRAGKTNNKGSKPCFVFFLTCELDARRVLKIALKPCLRSELGHGNVVVEGQRRVEVNNANLTPTDRRHTDGTIDSKQKKNDVLSLFSTALSTWGRNTWN